MPGSRPLSRIQSPFLPSSKRGWPTASSRSSIRWCPGSGPARRKDSARSAYMPARVSMSEWTFTLMSQPPHMEHWKMASRASSLISSMRLFVRLMAMTRRPSPEWLWSLYSKYEGQIEENFCDRTRAIGGNLSTDSRASLPLKGRSDSSVGWLDMSGPSKCQATGRKDPVWIEDLLHLLEDPTRRVRGVHCRLRPRPMRSREERARRDQGAGCLRAEALHRCDVAGVLDIGCHDQLYVTAAPADLRLEVTRDTVCVDSALAGQCVEAGDQLPRAVHRGLEVDGAVCAAGAVPPVRIARPAAPGRRVDQQLQELRLAHHGRRSQAPPTSLHVATRAPRQIGGALLGKVLDARHRVDEVPGGRVAHRLLTLAGVRRDQVREGFAIHQEVDVGELAVEHAIARVDERLRAVGTRDVQLLNPRQHLALGRAPVRDPERTLRALHEPHPVVLPGTHGPLLEVSRLPLLLEAPWATGRPRAEQVARAKDHLDAEQRIRQVPL